MKLFPTYAILAIATTLTATTVVANTIVTNLATPSAPMATANLIAKKESTPLAKQLQGKPAIVDIYASWCPACKNIAPTLSQLKQQYAGKANFIVFDVSDSKKTQASMKMASQLGLTNFFNANKSQTSTVAIIDPATGKIVKQFRNNAEIGEYTQILDSSIAQIGNGDAMKKGNAKQKP